MPDLKLGKLPDRTPVKHTIVVGPELEQKLRDYAHLYRETYDEAEAIETLIPFMLEAFLASDRTFSKSRRTKLTINNSRQRKVGSILSESVPTDVDHRAIKKTI